MGRDAVPGQDEIGADPAASAAELPATRILLVGMMGSGKSAVGRALARLTGWPFVDNDALLHAATGLTARELLDEGGEGVLRAGESAAFRAALERPIPVVLAVAAGVIVDSADRAAIASAGGVVWLRASTPTLARRAQGADHRPWPGGDPPGWLERTGRERAPLYESVSDLVVDVDRARPAAVARTIVEHLRRRGGSEGGRRPTPGP
jgi:shikimate kinase